MPEIRKYVLGWCSPDQAHFWGRTEAYCERCPGKIGDMVCACKHHTKTTTRRKVVRRKRVAT